MALPGDVCRLAGCLTLLPRPQSYGFTPKSSCLKLNIAVILKKDGAVDGIGIIIRNTQRRIIAATCEPSFFPGDVVQLGAIAIRRGLCFARNMGSTRVIKEGDIRELFLALKEPGPCFASYGTLVEDIRMESVGFSELSFNCIPPSCNSAALSPAKEALSCDLNQVWFGECPAFLTPFV